jgi:pyrroloquinoline quinone biosynthesis protein B
MHVLVLGSAAGGGFPQWNCRCPNCQSVREGSINAESRTQSSIAVSADGKHWILVNASPDIRTQLSANSQMWPATGVRHTPISAVLLTDAQVDHVTGLMVLREGCPLDLYCTPSVHEELRTSFPLLNVLNHWNGGFQHTAIPENIGEAFQVGDISDLEFISVPLISNAPPFSPRRNNPRPGDNIGLFITDKRTGKSLFYAPGLGPLTEDVWNYMMSADCVLVDGTFWTNDEMRCVGLSEKLGIDMGHLPLSGDDGMISVLRKLPETTRRVLIHINNTNPILDRDSEQYQSLKSESIEVSHDGMELII